MKIAANVFTLPAFFFIPLAVIYGFVTEWHEWVGVVALLLTAGLSLMIGIYLHMVDKKAGPQPEDSPDALIAEDAGEYGVFSPWSWWPLVLSAGVALGFLALAAGWWIMVPAAIVTIIGLVGWVFEFSVGKHAH